VDNDTVHDSSRNARSTQEPGAAIILPARLVLLGAPRTKKNSGRWLKFGRRTKLVPSAAYLTWRNAVVPQLRLAWAGRPPIAFPVNVAAVFYRDAARGDLVNFMQSLADVLEEARVVENDRLIQGWDGSRLTKDAARSRVELGISNAT
jgi:hypothetical protein